MLNCEDTICAVATAPGRGLQTVIRISGPQAISCLAALSDLDPDRLPQQTPFRTPIELQLPEPLGNLPAAAYIWPTHRSYTGQPSVELHAPASPPLVHRIIERLNAAGARGAGPGEFTLRAFLAGQLDLLQAEAVLGAIHADEPAQLRQALDQLSGGVSHPLERAREQLLEIVAHLEAGLDFVEEDIEFIERNEVTTGIAHVHRALDDVEQKMGRGRVESDRATIVLRGLPNAGKSTLMNALCEGDVALVADLHGTTRDPVEATIRIGQFDVQLIDTAGLERRIAKATEGGPSQPDAAGSSLEAITDAAQALGIVVAKKATLQLLCIDLAKPELDSWERRTIEQHASHDGVLLVGTRVDIAVPSGLVQTRCDCVVSAVTGQGMAALREMIHARLQEQLGHGGTATARSQAALNGAREALRRAESLIVDHGPEELITIELRSALDAIGRLTGKIYTDDILDQVFSRFCIGK